MAVSVEAPTAIVLSTNFERCLQWSCRKCRSYALEPEIVLPSTSSGSGGRNAVPVQQASSSPSLSPSPTPTPSPSPSPSPARLKRCWRCTKCWTPDAGVPSFFVQLSLDVEGEFVRAVASDDIVEQMVGCSALQWHKHHEGDQSGLARLVDHGLRGTVCSLTLRFPKALHSDPKIARFEPRKPFWPFYKPASGKR